jgi:chitodextrinase
MKKFVVAIVLATAVLAISAGPAAATEFTVATSSYTHANETPDSVSITSTYATTDNDFTSIRQFVAQATDSTCSSADNPGNIIDMTTTELDALSGFVTTDFEIEPQSYYCVGTYFLINNSVAKMVMQPLYYGKPWIEYADKSIHPHGIDLSLDVHTNGLPSTYHLSYFKQVESAQCSSPDADDLSTAQATDPVTIASDLNSVHTIETSISGLDLEASYCVAYRVTNGAGSNDLYYWGFETPGDIPTVANPSFSALTGRISYTTDITPNSYYGTAWVVAQYFVKSGSQACADFTGSITSTPYYGPGGAGPSGLATANMGTTLYNLTPSTTYCIRINGENLLGASPLSPWSEVTTKTKLPGTVTNIGLTQDTDPAAETGDALLKFTLDDVGAMLETTSQSIAGITLVQTAASNCNDSSFGNGPPVFAEYTIGYGATTPFTYEVPDLILGVNYCFHAQLYSSWNTGYEATASKNFVYGQPPDTGPPSKVTGLAASNVTRTSATLSWNAASDDLGVTQYRVFRNGQQFSGSAATSAQLSLACGVKNSYYVVAGDAVGNWSDPSDAIDVTGAACDVPASPSPSPAKKCFSPVKSVSAKGTVKKRKKYSVKLSGKVSADGQSVVISSKITGGVKLTFKVGDAKVAATRGSITVTNNPSLVTVSFKVKGATKKLKIQLAQTAC